MKALVRNSVQIGGPGRVNEIRERKIWKRKLYNKDRRMDSVWVFGGIDRASRECFLVSVDGRSAATLGPIIKKAHKTFNQNHLRLLESLYFKIAGGRLFTSDS